jgi:protein disulfide-isomerase A1
VDAKSAVGSPNRSPKNPLLSPLQDPSPLLSKLCLSVHINNALDIIAFIFKHDVQVEFYAPWCGHCKNLKPAWAEAATKLKDHDDTILIAKVDATEQKDLQSRFEVKGFPTIKWFVDGEVAMDYNAGRSASEIVAWVKKKSGPPTTVIQDADALAKAKTEEVSMFAYFDKLEGEDHDAFESFASKNDDASFYKITDAALAKELGLAKAASYAVGRNYAGFGFESASSEGHAAFKDDKATLGDRLAALLQAEKLPAFLEFSPATQSRIFGSGIDKQVIVVAPSAMFEPKAALYKDVVAASSKTRGRVVWVTAKPDVESAAVVLNYFGLDKDVKDPQVVGFFATGGKKYAFPEGDKVNAKTLEAFAEKVLDGTAPRQTKSAPVPKEPEDEGVAVVVGSTFESIVKDPKKDVLLEVYAPWCGHCKALAPTYVKLAKRFKNIDSVVIAKMDGTENEVPDLEVKGYPTLLFFPAEKDAKPISLDGGRDLASLTKFIKKHAKVEYELPKKSDAKDVEDGVEEEEEEKKPEGHEEL